MFYSKQTILLSTVKNLKSKIRNLKSKMIYPQSPNYPLNTNNYQLLFSYSRPYFTQKLR